MWLYGALPLAGVHVASAALGSSSTLVQQTSLLGRANRTVALGGTEVAISQGLENPDRSVPLIVSTSGIAGVGLHIHSNEGTVTYVVESGPDVTAFLGGSSSTTEIESMVASRSKPASGTEVATAQGSPTVTNRPTTNTGVVSVSGIGSVVYQPGVPLDVTVNLNAGEMEVNCFAGNVRTASPLSGLASAGETGTLGRTNTPTDTLLGMEMLTAVGTMAVQSDVEDTFIASSMGTALAVPEIALLGIEIAVGQGTLSATADATSALLGAEALVEAGSVGFENEYALTGLEMLGEQTDDNFGLPLNIELLGAEALVQDGTVYLNDDRAYPLIGTEVLVETTNPHMDVNAFLSSELVLVEQHLFEQVVELEGVESSFEQGRFGRDRPNDAGSNGDAKKDKKRKKVTIDGQTFEVNEDELRDLVKVVEEVATAKAKEEADALLVIAQAEKLDKIRLKAPKVTGSEELKDKLADIYAQAAIDAQVALEVSRNRQLDEEEAIVLLLVN